MPCFTLAHVPSTLLRQVCGLLSGHRSATCGLAALKDEERWRKLSDRSYYSPASTCLPDVEDFPDLEEIEVDSPDEDTCHRLHAGLFFYDPCQPESLGEQRRLLPANYIKMRPDGDVSVVGARHGGDEAEAVEVAPACLIIDVKAAPDDEARLTRITGARLNAGKLGRISIDGNSGGIMCEVLRGSVPVAQLSLQEALEQMLELEKRRRNAELQKYQRQLCSMLMNTQRKRLLGLTQ